MLSTINKAIQQKQLTKYAALNCFCLLTSSTSCKTRMFCFVPIEMLHSCSLKGIFEGFHVMTNFTTVKVFLEWYSNRVLAFIYVFNVLEF